MITNLLFLKEHFMRSLFISNPFYIVYTQEKIPELVMQSQILTASRVLLWNIFKSAISRPDPASIER